MQKSIRRARVVAPLDITRFRRRVQSTLQRGFGPLLMLTLWMTLGTTAAHADTRVYKSIQENPNTSITRIPATGTSGTAEFYPLRTVVPDVQGQVVLGVTVQLNTLFHAFPDDLDIMLVAPNGQNVMLMSDCGGTADLAGNFLTFDDAAATGLPDSTQITGGTYKPTDFEVGTDGFPYPAPAPSGSISLSSLNGINPTGTWSVFIVDDANNWFGSLGNGFQLTLKLGYANRQLNGIPDSALPPTKASIYPSTLNVSGLTGTVSSVTLRLNGLTHGAPNHLDILLVGPGGQKALVMSDAGGGSLNPITNISFTLDDAAATNIPTVIEDGGRFKPTNSGAPAVDTFPAPAPAGPYTSPLSAFNGTNPNGQWQLFIVDDSSNQSGGFAGWVLEINTTPPVIAFSSAAYSVVEGGSIPITVTRSPGNGVSTVNINTSGLTATGAGANADFSSFNFPLTFADGETSQQVFLNTNDDARDEMDETIGLGLFGPQFATVGAPSPALVTITDNDAPPILTLAGATAAENTSSLPFTYQLSAVSDLPISFSVATVDGTATLGSDFTAPATTVNIPAGTTSGTINVPITNDTLDEADENLSLVLSSPTNVTLGNTTATGVILDDDASPTLSINDASIVEGNSGSSLLNFTLSLSAASAQPISVNYSMSGGTATPGDDYLPSISSATIAPGQTSRQLSVLVYGDVAIEGDETFNVNLSSVVNASVGDGQGVGTIVNDDSEATLPKLTIGNVSFREGNNGTTNAVFTVSLSANNQQTVTVNYSTADGTATAGSDYQTTSGTLSFASGVSSQTVVVPVTGDSIVEADETFAVNLSGAINAVVTTASAAATILNDDAAPVVTPVPAPQIFLFSPSSGLRGSGTIIAGLNFAGASAVKFNGATAKFIILSPTQIKATVPLTATTGKISITTPAGTGTSSSDYVVIPPPTFTSFTPASGPVGTFVTVSGKNFDGASIVKVNGRIVPFQLLTGGKLRLTIANGTTTGKISVSTPAGTSTSTGSFVVTPKIESFTPTSGPVGTVVTINGFNFTGVKSVKFNTAVAKFTVSSAFKMIATVPAGATTGKISIVGPTNAVALSGTNFTVTTAAPALSGTRAVSGLSSATASADTIKLQFVAPLSTDSNATYRVSVNGEEVEVESINVSGSTVTLGLPQSTLKSGDNIEVSWTQLPSAAGHALSGSTTVIAK